MTAPTPIEELKVERRGDVAMLTIDRPRKRNALHGPLWDALGAQAKYLAGESLRALVVTGSGGHFCAGMDLSMDNPLTSEIAPVAMGGDEDGARRIIEHLKGTLEPFRHVPFPVIAAIEGACTGGGMELALVCDLRVASRDAFFSLPETHHGMVPDLGGTVRSVRLVGTSRATDLVLTGRRIDAEEAHGWGLVNRLADNGTALDSALELAGEIRIGGPKATAAALAVLRGTAGLDDVQALEAETRAGIAALCSGEPVEGIMAFGEKRPTRWSGEPESGQSE